MIATETAMLFFFASVALALAPGPDNIFVLTQSALFGRRAGLLVTCGLCTGLLVHTSAVALGIAAVFQTSALAFNALKIAGALYLLYLAWIAFRTGARNLTASETRILNARNLYLRGVIMNLSNPKVAIFFLAFLPQFADASDGSMTLQLLLLGAIFITATLLVFGFIAWTAGFLAHRLRESSNAQVVLNRVAGGVFTALAFRLLVARQ